MGIAPDGLWEQGTYWHLKTRPQELEALTDKRLKNAAELIDHTLRSCSYKTLVHGDAKLANFCFFQRGCPVGRGGFSVYGRRLRDAGCSVLYRKLSG